MSWSDDVLVVPTFARCSRTAAATVGSTVPVQWLLVIDVFSGTMLTSRGPAWLNLFKNIFYLIYLALH